MAIWMVEDAIQTILAVRRRRGCPTFRSYNHSSGQLVLKHGINVLQRSGPQVHNIQDMSVEK